MKIYQCYPRDEFQNKTEIYDWCYQNFGPGNLEELGWSLHSNYDERPIVEINGEFVNSCPFLFSTEDPKKFSWFRLKWS